MKMLVLALVLGALLVAGCGEDVGGGPQNDTETRIPQNDFKPIVITYNGFPLHCIARKGSGGQYNSGQNSGLDCDFVRYWRER